MTLEESLRSVVVLAAAAEIGPGDVNKYWGVCMLPGPPYPKYWCGAFCLWAIKQAGLAADVPWIIGRGFCEPAELTITITPLAGDIAYIDDPWQHHALVECVEGNVLVTIDGNQPDVQRRRRTLPMAIQFYSIQPLIDVYIGSLTDG